MLKKLLSLWIVLLVAVLTACGTDDPESVGVPEDVEADVDPVSAEVEETDTDEDQSIEVNRGLLNVEVTLPASLFEESDFEDAIEAAKAEGVKEIIVNDNGSLTYKMSRSTHNDMMKQMKESLDESIAEIKNSGDFASIVDVTSNSSYSEFTLIVEQKAFENSFDGFASFGVAIAGLMYQAFDGVSPDKNKVTVHYENAETGEVFSSVVFPDALDDM